MMAPSLLSRGVGDSEGFLKLGGDARGGSAGRTGGLVFEELEFAFVAGVFLEFEKNGEKPFQLARGSLSGEGVVEEAPANDIERGAFDDFSLLGRCGESTGLLAGFGLEFGSVGGLGAVEESVEGGNAGVEAEAVGTRLGEALLGLKEGGGFEPVEELFLFGGGKGVFDKEVFTHRMGWGLGWGRLFIFLLCSCV